MDKVERDRILTNVTEDQRPAFQDALRQLRSYMKESGGRRMTVRGLLETGTVQVAAEARAPLVAVAGRDDTGPEPGELPPDFSLKKKGSGERVRLSSFHGKRPVALIFGSYT